MKLTNTKRTDMSKKTKSKKPTMAETVTVINQLIREITAMKTDIQTFSGIIDLYIEMKGDSDNFHAFVNKELNVEENNDVRTNEEGSAVAVEGSPQD